MKISSAENVPHIYMYCTALSRSLLQMLWAVNKFCFNHGPASIVFKYRGLHYAQVQNSKIFGVSARRVAVRVYSRIYYFK
jgi:hypothetical protein